MQQKVLLGAKSAPWKDKWSMCLRLKIPLSLNGISRFESLLVSANSSSLITRSFNSLTRSLTL